MGMLSKGSSVKGSPPSFTGYADISTLPRVWVLDVCGPEGAGKTHIALTAPNPAICDTELKAWRLIGKPGIPTELKACYPKEWMDVQAFTEFVSQDPNVDTVIFDTLKEIEEMAYRATLDELGKESLYSRDAGAVQYRYVNQKMEELLKLLRKAGKSVITTARQKDEYVKNDRTGNKLRDGWSKMPYYADFCVEAVNTLPGVPSPLLKPGIVIWKVTKNGAVVRGLYRPYIVAEDYCDMLRQLQLTEQNVDAYLEELKKAVTRD